MQLPSKTHHYTETVVQKCSKKMLFLKILQISQENACARVPSLLKLEALELYLKRDSGKGFAKFLRTPFLRNTLSGYFCV